MSLLRLYRDDGDPSRYQEHRGLEDIAGVAAEYGILFERWSAQAVLADDATQADVLAAYDAEVTRLKRERGFTTADVISVGADTPDHQAIRRKFLAEHTHSEDEARFFVAGSGLFCIHAAGAVLGIRCEQGDLINVPSGATHWFDMGPHPQFRCIRLFTEPSGWVAQFTGSDIASRFPSMEASPSG